VARKYELEGPARSKWSLAALGRRLGFDEDSARETVRRLIAEGHLPRPRGRGDHLYYSGLDVAVILEFYGRWGPATQDGAKPPPARRAKADDEPPA
jgi:hypothetical protein